MGTGEQIGERLSKTSAAFSPMPDAPLPSQVRDLVVDGQHQEVVNPVWNGPEFRRYAERPTGTPEQTEAIFND